MTYRISGLDPSPFQPLFAMNEAQLAERRALRREADSATGFPCRVSLEDAKVGEELLLTHFVSHPVETPFRSAFAIYVRRDATAPASFTDQVPEMLARRTLALRGFDSHGMLRAAMLAAPGEADGAIRDLLGNSEVRMIHAHNAAYGCFLAAIERN